MMRQEEEAKYAGERKSKVGTGDRSERIRTYNFPQSRNRSSDRTYRSQAGSSDERGD